MLKTTIDATIRYLLYSQIAILIALVVCTIIDPSYLFSSNQGGVSNFGAQLSTVVPYSLGLLVSSIYMLLAARTIRSISDNKMLPWVIVTIALLQLVVLFTTFAYKISEAWHGYHILSTQVYFVALLVAATWFALMSRTRAMWVAYMLFMFGFIVAVLTLFGVLYVLFIAEVVTIVAFGAVMIIGTGKILRGKQHV